jgi:superfamily II DNA helicase RecQ
MPAAAVSTLVYQLAAQFLPSVTLVGSPLLALIKDQVDGLAELGATQQRWMWGSWRC